LWAIAYTDGNGNGDGCSVGYAHSNGYGYGDGDGYCIANTKEYGHTTAASYTASSTVSLGLRAAFFGNSRSSSRVPEKP